MNAIKFFVTFAVLAACIFAVCAVENDNARQKRFPFFGGYGAYPYGSYGAYPYAAGYGVGAYGAYGAYGGYGSYGAYGAYPYSGVLAHY